MRHCDDKMVHRDDYVSKAALCSREWVVRDRHISQDHVHDAKNRRSLTLDTQMYSLFPQIANSLRNGKSIVAALPKSPYSGQPEYTVDCTSTSIWQPGVERHCAVTRIGRSFPIPSDARKVTKSRKYRTLHSVVGGASAWSSVDLHRSSVLYSTSPVHLIESLCRRTYSRQARAFYWWVKGDRVCSVAIGGVVGSRTISPWRDAILELWGIVWCQSCEHLNDVWR